MVSCPFLDYCPLYHNFGTGFSFNFLQTDRQSASFCYLRNVFKHIATVHTEVFVKWTVLTFRNLNLYQTSVDRL